MTRGRDGYAQPQRPSTNVRRKELKMIYYTCLLLAVGVMATVLGLDGVGAAAIELAAVLFMAEMAFELAVYLAPKRAGRV
jgi:uncharacterized membrane protein YtjA (UPF0391 family)